ncbi:hypothetical protein TCAL_04216 [Tigriopus californicus]|uniref:Uncharacterized protein n=1 Tax=Tigriopus californicus TaxID=6832 RepID=A0A553N695_TIGCA|nr:uncharacterized protein LOC131885005 [Tigriopus californicus]TRY60937.1 hypothetical protein TCAL_04216 [Tigriopus californicus]|eukprot:TCALIF_04216-PA protein Name:"Similar to SMC6 Structural maintenance of chromosomes protein 6 (Homo sapiens)" AED:0.02 eAED:0.02 QI:155/1/1/1/1/1/4/110/1099
MATDGRSYSGGARKRLKVLDLTADRPGDVSLKPGGLSGLARERLDWQAQQDQRSGILREIDLTNFMNHASLHLVLQSRINLISGRNGAGKSSVLQAIVLGLGAQAKDTKRSSHLASFIRNDCTKAEIRIRMWNGGLNAYRPEVYGQTILFERVIYRQSSGSTHILKDHRGQVVHTGKVADEEKRRICEHFSIQLNNPIAILQQEEAKVFFHNADNKMLYDFFVRATLLKALQDMYQNANSELLACDTTLTEKRQDLSKVGAEKNDLAEKCQRMKKVDCEIKQMEAQLREECLWGYAQSKAQEAADIREKTQKLEEKLKRENASLNELLKSKDRLEDEKKILEESHKMSEAEIRAITMEYQMAREDNENAQSKLEVALVDLQTKESALAALRDQEKTLSNDIRSKRTMHEKRNEQRDREKKEADQALNRIEGEIKRKNRLIQERGRTRDDLGKEIEDLSVEMNPKNAEIDQILQQKQILMEELNKRKRTNANVSNLKRFGFEFEDLIQDINRCKDFKEKPIGPIGRHIKLVGKAAKDKNLADLLETELGKGFLRGFLVASWEDSKALSALFERHFHRRRPPSIIIWKFRGQKDNIEHGKVQTNPEMPGMLDYLEFDHPDVFNYVVDYKRVESTIVVDQVQAQKLFSQVKNVPKNAESAISPDFYRFIPATKGNYASYFMERPRRGAINCLTADTQSDLANLSTELKECDVIVKELKSALIALSLKKKSLEARRDDNIETIHQLNKELGNLKQDMTKINLNRANLEQGDNLPEMEERLTNLRQEIKKTEASVKELKQRKTKSTLIEKKTKGLLDKQTERMNEASKCNLESKLSDINDEIGRQDAVIRKIQTAMNSIRAELKPLNSSLLEAEARYETAKTQARNQSKKDVSEPVDKAKLMARQKELAATRKELESQLQMTPVELASKLEKIRNTFNTLAKQLKEVEMSYKKIKAMQENRKNVYRSIRLSLIRSVQTLFIIHMKQHNLIGDLELDNTNKTLNIKVSHLKGSEAGEALPLSSLSGGERSKTLVCLMIASWEYMAPPFRCLDEWDVYLDERSRSSIEEVLFEYAQSQDYQYILISPQGSTLKGANIIEIGKSHGQ